MKKHLIPVLAAFALAALCLPSPAQEEELDGAATETSSAAAPAKPAAKKAPAKKKSRKKKPFPEVSEYKFSAVESVPAYKFDKQANPIVKNNKKKKKPAKKTSAGKPSQPAVKLQPAKPLAEEGAEEQRPQDQQETE